MYSYFIGIIIAASEEKSSNLDTLLKTDKKKLNDDCYDRALMAAVEKNRCANAEKMIIVGATNIDEAMKLAKQADIKLMLLMAKAVLEDDYQLITEITEMAQKGKKTPSDTNHMSNPNYDILNSEEIKAHISRGKMKTRVPIKLSIKLKKPKVILNKLLSITNVNFDAGTIGWNNLNLAELDTEWIRNLPKHMVIKQLNLSQNQLSSLPISITSQLRNCTKLDLHQNDIRYVPASILELPVIKELNLSNNKITELPKVLWSASLIKLNLSHNELNTLPDCATEMCTYSMTVLKLENNQLKEVPKCICFLSNLNALDISYNPKILILPPELGRLESLKQLHLEGLHHLYDPPPSICENLTSCISYLRSQFLKQSKYYRMKLMVVGKPNVGKTTMIRCLQGRQYPKKSTDGVEIGKWSYRPSLFKTTFSFSVWDFAGQEEYYTTHQVFLSKQSLYLAVWNVMEGKDGIKELKPWLSNIFLLASESQVLIVATHLDLLIAKFGKDQAEAKCAEYEGYIKQSIPLITFNKNVAKILFVGLIGRRENVPQLKKEIYNAAEKCTIDGQPIMGSSIPASYERVDNELHKLTIPILHAKEFKEMVRSLGQIDLQSEDEIRALTLFLHGIGSLLHFNDHRHNLDDLYFVKPQWLCKLMSTVVTVENKYVKNGRITKPEIKQLFEQASKDYPEELLEQYLALFNRFEIVLPLDKGGDLLLIPCFLPSNRPIIVEELSQVYHYQRQFIFYDAITPPGLWSRLLSRLMNTIDEVRDLLGQNDNENGELYYWNKGLYCRSHDLLFIIESCSPQGEGISIIYSFKAAREGLLSKLVNLVQQIVNEWFPGLQYEQIFRCYECLQEKHERIFKLKEVLDCIAESKPVNCDVCHKDLDLKALAPDLLLDDISPQCIINIKSICHDENVIYSGRFGKVYRGDVHSREPVIVKFYDTSEDSQSASHEVQFRNFRAEVTYLQKIKHPCLVAMLGVCRYPHIALVMENSPEGSLDLCLFKELQNVSRIVVYRIAAQIASALRALHSIPVIYRNLTASKILIWSLSLDDFINCKLADLEVASYEDLRHVGSSFAGQFFAPELCKQAIYDQRVDIFSFGIVLLQMLHRSYPIEDRQSIPEWEIPLTFDSLSIPSSELHHIGLLAKNCCNCKPADRPDLQEIVEQLCKPVFQLVIDVATFSGIASCACTGCTQQTDYSSEAWVCCRYADGSEIIVLSLKSIKLESNKKYFIKSSHEICSMLSHNDYVWATSMQADQKGSLLKFDSSKKDEYIEVPFTGQVTVGGNSLPDDDYGISLACTDDHVYVGTINGWCLKFPTDISHNTMPLLGEKLSCHYIRSMVFVKKTSLLWVSAGDQLLFINCINLEFDHIRKGHNVNQRVGNLLLSPDEETVWSCHINGHSILAWNAQKRELISSFNSYHLLDNTVDQQKSKITSTNVVLDTLWVGLISGHILVVSATLSQSALIIMKPYNERIDVLVPIHDKNNNISMISIGKDYQKQSVVKNQKSLNLVLWDVVDAKHMLQMKYLSTGNAWLNAASLTEVYAQL